MRRTTILNAKQVKRTSFSEAEQLFTKHCKLKNLSPQTMRYYAEDLKYFHACVPIQYVDEVSQDAFENFMVDFLCLFSKDDKRRLNLLLDNKRRKKMIKDVRKCSNILFPEQFMC